MGTLVYHHDPPARARETLRDDAAGLARANHQNVDLHTTLDHRLRHRYYPYLVMRRGALPRKRPLRLAVRFVPARLA
jgi:hypothetical protein